MTLTPLDAGTVDAAMAAALDQARDALGSSDIPVGAVVLSPAGEVIAAGRNEREALSDPTAHAEDHICGGETPRQGDDQQQHSAAGRGLATR